MKRLLLALASVLAIQPIATARPFSMAQTFDVEDRLVYVCTNDTPLNARDYPMVDFPVTYAIPKNQPAILTQHYRDYEGNWWSYIGFYKTATHFTSAWVSAKYLCDITSADQL